MKRLITLLSIASVVLLTSAEEIALSGSIVNVDGTPIAGALLRLKKHPQLTTETDSSGSFSLVGATPISFTTTSGYPSAQVYIHNKYLTIITSRLNKQVNIEIFNSCGKKLFSTQLVNCIPGTHMVPLAGMRTAQGLYLVRITTSQKTQVVKLVITGREYLAGSTMSMQAPTSSNVAKMYTYAIIDTLIVTSLGHKDILLGVEQYIQQNIVCSLAVPNPWIPTGALEYNDGMVKVMANGYDFKMGQPDPNIWGPNTSNLEQPMHTVSFTHDFWMDTALVTQKEYDTLMSDTYADYLSPTWLEPYGVGDSLPTYAIMWGDAALYCNALSKQDGLDTVYRYDTISGTPGYLSELLGLNIDLSKNGYRLPTEAEWEYACRGGTFTDFYWGKNLDNYPANAADTAEIGSYTIWTVNSWDIVIGDEFGVYPVASKKPNAYGLYDMSGQLYEWCNDWDNFLSYNWGPAVDPTGADSTGFHIARGGSWGNNATHLRSANRYFVPADYLYYFLGFRVVLPI